MEKVVTARKDYQCCYCDRTIAKGEKHVYMEGRTSRIINRHQVGIWFWKARLCEEGKCCKAEDYEVYQEMPSEL